MRQQRTLAWFLPEALEPRLAPAQFAPLPGAPDDLANPSSFRAALAAANSNADASNTITLAAGTYVLGYQSGSGALTIADQAPGVPAKTLVIQGAGAGQTTIDGNRQFEDGFQLTGATGASMTVVLQDLTITDFTGTGTTFSNGANSTPPGSGGGALYVAGGTVSLENVVMSNDVLQGLNAPKMDPLPPGGSGVSGIDGGPAAGGAIYLASGGLTLQDDTFVDDQALAGYADAGLNGGNGGQGGSAFGGAIYVAGGTLAATGVTFQNNAAVGADGGGGLFGGAGGTGSGGALYVATGSVTLSNVSFASNSATGGAGGIGSNTNGTASTTATGGSGGNASGGGITIGGGSLSLNQASFDSNQAVAGNGGDYESDPAFPSGGFHGGNGGTAAGGGLKVEGGMVTSPGTTTLLVNTVQGGSGGTLSPNGTAATGSPGAAGVSLGSAFFVVGGTLNLETTPPSSSAGTVVVLGAQRQMRTLHHKKPEQVLVVTYSAPLSPSAAQNLAAYQLVSAGQHKTFRSRWDRPVKLSAAHYNAGADSVTLTPRHDQVPTGPLELKINTAQILDAQGTSLGGDGGPSYVTVKVAGPKKMASLASPASESRSH